MRKRAVFMQSDGLDGLNAFCGTLEEPDDLRTAISNLVVGELDMFEQFDEEEVEIVLSVREMTDEEIAAIPIV